MTLPIYRVLPHPLGGWCFTKAKAWRWPSVRRALPSFSSVFRAMDAAFERPDVLYRRQVCWITNLDASADKEQD